MTSPVVPEESSKINPLPSVSKNTQVNEKKTVNIKISMLGDSAIGKTTLMNKYVEGKLQEDYIETLGVNFMEKNITGKNTDINFTIWDLGGQKEYYTMMDIVCNGADVILFMFDLTRIMTLEDIKDWYKNARKLNKTAIPFLIGTKFDLFFEMEKEYKDKIMKISQQYAIAMKSPLIYCSSTKSINIKNIFKIIVSKMFSVKCDVKQTNTADTPIILY